MSYHEQDDVVMTDLPRFSVAAIDLGFDPRLADMAVEYPEWCGDGPIVLEYSTDTRRSDTPSEKVTQLCDSKAAALRILRRHGYRIVFVRCRR